ncbi:Kazal-type serine protease inhibitor family protein [Paraliomyxa miuraensis]|uniref:hypothetical protein n=1 Tax=Paraliomyxa miuraensis TaxID=376150 RepID=UPI0022505DF0|nr:hypothetical protein [Paraliomyxa miuraensis]MCX4247541.1 hypothetical protein [Paraliomyxa miuraensis]
MRGRSTNVVGMAAVLALGGLGCSPGDFGDDTGTGTTVVSDDGPQTAPGLDESGTGDEGGGSTGEPEVADPSACDGLSCGEGGLCELDEDGRPVCVCDPGYAAYGLRCVPCVPTEGLLDVDVPTASVSASFLLRGRPFPSSFYEHGQLVLRDPQSGDEVVLGSTLDGGTTADVMVIPGSYELHYVRRAGGLEVPANESARMDTVELAPGDAASWEIDVPAVDLHGSILMNGSPAPASLYENGELVLRQRSTGDEVVLGESYDGEYRVMVLPGTYDLHYRRKLAQDVMPINRDARLATVDVDGFDDLELTIDVPVANLSGSFTLDGAAPPAGAYESGRILLRDLWTHDEVVLGNTNDGSYEAPIVAGDYEVVYQRLLGGDQVPVNQRAVLGQVTLAAGRETHDVDIATAVISGTITVGGAAAPADPADDGLILLRNPDTGDEAVLGNTADGSYTRRVVRGTYDVHYRQETSSGGVPVNTNARLSSIDVMGGASFDVDVPMVTVSTSVTVGGAAPPSSVYDDGLLYLVDEQTGDAVLLGNTRLASLQRPVVPGTYDLLYVVEAAGPTMPINSKSWLGSVDVNAPTDLAVDIPVAVFQGAITLNGATPPGGFYDRASLVLHDVLTDDEIDLGTIDVGSFARTINAGTYVLAYRMLATTGDVPANTNAGLVCVELTAP